ncbi:MAG: hypothetical protein PHX47_02910 [Candidatus ainarchaeum sp.]|nr:hypothetical protein [Candidatus ainarchaeum sp.]
MKKKVSNKQNLIIALLIILIILVIFFIAIFSANILYSNIKENNIDYNLTISQLDQNSDVVVNMGNDVNFSELNEFTLPESELVNEYLISSENISNLKNIYSFLFDEALVSSYGYLQTEEGDYILEYKDYILVFNKDENQTKSIWRVQNLE